MKRSTLGLSLAGIAGALLVSALRRRARRIDLRGRVAIVTGGGRGLGLAITRELVRQGCRVAICGREAKVIRRAVEAFERAGAEVFGEACDASVAEQVQGFVDRVRARYGHIDVLVNNAGQCFVGPAPELSAKDMARALRHIFWTQYYPTMAVLPHLRERRFGRIANVTSFAGKVPVPHQSAYVAAKYAATGWSETLAAELDADGIGVSTITPPPLRNGAPLHVHYNGHVDGEFAWFTRTLTSPWTAASADRTARVVVDALRHADGERAVGWLGWSLARVHGVAPNLMAPALAWLARRLPPPAPPGVASSMRVGTDVAAHSSDRQVKALADRARADEARYRPEGAVERTDARG
jgi:NAD(P)-dependent dehydrogenase (short-subunit alcohol dehydrogenase family)